MALRKNCHFVFYISSPNNVDQGEDVLANGVHAMEIDDSVV